MMYTAPKAARALTPRVSTAYACTSVVDSRRFEFHGKKKEDVAKKSILIVDLN
jgi:hypothetical protein